MILEIEFDELHKYQSGTAQYELKQEGFTEYQSLIVRGYVALDSGSVNHYFVQDEDYQLRDRTIVWLGEDIPAVPPSHLGYTYTPFWVTYVYEERPESTIKKSIYSFIDNQGVLAAVVRSFGTQVYRQMQKNDRLMRSRSLVTSLGTELNMLGSWYNTIRLQGETDVAFRSRLQQFLSTFLSSGTSDAIISIMEAITGAEPSILELFQETSYYDFNPSDATLTYVYDDGASDNIAKYFDFSNQPATFYCIFDPADYAVFTTHGPYVLKALLNQSKAEGITAYLGYLVDEAFGANDDNWDRQASAIGDVSIPADWSVTGGKYKYLSAGVSSGLSVIDNSDFDGAWGDYQVTAYARCATNTAAQVAGVVTRWQASGADADDLYLFGVSAFDDMAYAYYWDDSGASWLKKAEKAVVIAPGTEYHLRVVMRGESAFFYVDNTLVIDDSDLILDPWDEILYGRPGFAAYSAGAAVEAYFDDMNVVI